MKYIFYLVLLITSFQCTWKKNSENTLENDCKQKNKIDLLVKDVFNRIYLCTPLRLNENQSKNKSINLISDGLINTGEIFYIKFKNTNITKDSLKLISLDSNKINDKNLLRAHLKIENTNFDTTNVDFHLAFIIKNHILLSAYSFNCEFDKKDCKWIYKDSSYIQY